MEECSLGPEYATREGRNFFEVFKVKEEGEHQVASKWRSDLEDSEELKVSLSELKEQLETPEEAGFFFHVACQTGKE